MARAPKAPNKPKAELTTGLTPEMHQKLVANWLAGAGNPTTMEDTIPVAVLRCTLTGDPVTAVVVALSPDGQKAYGLVDDHAGDVGVKIFDLSATGWPNAEITPYTGDAKIYALMWLAREGKEYVG